MKREFAEEGVREVFEEAGVALPLPQYRSGGHMVTSGL